MWRALAKGAAMAAFGHTPGGSDLYRRLTREIGGTQVTHVDKLTRVLPDYARVWTERAGLRLEGARIWMYEGGWTPFPLLASYLLTGSGGTVTNGAGRMLGRYLVAAVNGALATAWPAGAVPDERRRVVEALRWASGIDDVLAATGGVLHAGVDAERPPLADGSVDLVHSGGALEHLPPAVLAKFLAASRRILAPGAIASHVFDHRDHLHHADRRWPFLAHLALPDTAYRIAAGHPLGYHSRLTPTQVAALFRAAGFELIALRRRILPEHRWVEGDAALLGTPGLPRRLLARRFRDISEIDLRTAAAHYLCRAI
ncbi:MAG TPA: class I SAM-dependent methyltransferase [Polyangia bacterium]|nr:class I SAM-dependent methyltransferase [Polyangia bacterium]